MVSDADVAPEILFEAVHHLGTESPRVLLDPNTWSKDGTVALTGLGFSDDGRYVAYSRSEAGSDWSNWHVLEIDSGKPLPDEIAAVYEPLVHHARADVVGRVRDQTLATLESALLG